jgi:ech hydrogenase subunit F
MKMPGMLREVLKNLFSKPATVRYPFEKPRPVPGTRGALEWDMGRCDECQDCERVCPSMAVKVYPEEKKVEYQPFKCLFCYLCVDNCMQKAIKTSEIVRVPEYEKKVEVYETKKGE